MMRMECPFCKISGDFEKGRNKYICPFCGFVINEVILVKVLAITSSIPDEIKEILISRQIGIQLFNYSGSDDEICTVIELPLKALRDEVKTPEAITFIDGKHSSEVIELKPEEFQIIDWFGYYKKDAIPSLIC